MAERELTIDLDVPNPLVDGPGPETDGARLWRRPPFRKQPGARLSPYGAAFLLWTAFGVVEGCQYYFIRSVGTSPVTWEHALRVSVPRMWVWALLTPAVISLARRIGRAWTLRTLAAHLAAAVGVSTLGLTLGAVVYFLTANESGVSFDVLLPAYFAAHSAVAVIAYVAIVGGYMAYDYRDRFRRRDLEAAELEVRASRLEARLSESRLRLLKEQLQPHFLFNTLHAVSTLVLKGQTGRAMTMVARLSDFLRLSLEQPTGQEIPLGDELEALERYLAIQQVRFEDRLRVERDVGPDALAALVPSMLLQPLAENAVQHGVEGSTGPARLRLCAHRQGDRLRVRVEDSGPGFRHGERVREGVGLDNTRQRLDALYGDRACMTLGNLDDGGACVEVVLPFRREQSGAPVEGAAPGAGR